MSRVVVAPIVEGHGEVASVRMLLERIWHEVVEGDFIEVLSPIRQPRERLARNIDRTLENATRLAIGKLSLSVVPDAIPLVLVLIDADSDPPCILGPNLFQIGSTAIPGTRLCCVIANVEYESWFVGAAESLRPWLNIRESDQLPIRPEESRSGKAWIEARFRGVRYSETIDQPRLTAKMDLLECRRNCPSFDKLCRELERFK